MKHRNLFMVATKVYSSLDPKDKGHLRWLKGCKTLEDAEKYRELIGKKDTIIIVLKPYWWLLSNGSLRAATKKEVKQLRK